MKTKVMLGIVVATIALAGCDNAERPEAVEGASAPDVKREYREAAEATKEYVAENKDQAVAAIEQQLREMDAQLDELARKAEGYTDQARAEADVALARLREQRAAAAAKLEELKVAGRDTWREVKAGFDNAMNELRKSYEELKDKFTN